MTQQQADADLTQRLTAILEDVLSRGLADVEGKDLINDRFAVLGVNSVDYLEFILNLEHALHIDIPDEAMMGPSMNSIRAWSIYLQQHAGALATHAA